MYGAYQLQSQFPSVSGLATGLPRTMTKAVGAVDHCTDHTLANSSSSKPQQYGADTMPISLRNTDRRIHGDSRNTSSRPAQRENQDWLTDQARKWTAKEGADLTGMSERAFENLRQGRNKVSFDKAVEWAKRDPEFAAAWAAHVGLILPGDVDFAAALTKTVNAFQRRGL